MRSEEQIVSTPAVAAGDHSSLDARVRVWWIFGYMVTLSWVPAGDWNAYGAAALILWGVLWWNRLRLWMIWRRSLIALPFALAALTLAVSRPGEALVTITLGGQTITATGAGVTAAVSVLLKAWLSVQAMAALAATTHFSALLGALATLRLPAVIVMILGIAYRYLFVMQHEALRMLRARDSRSAALAGRRSGRSIVWRAMITGRMAGTLFIRAYERSERLYAAMQARGYDGRVLLDRQPPLRRADWLALTVGGLLLIALIALAVT